MRFFDTCKALLESKGVDARYFVLVGILMMVLFFVVVGVDWQSPPLRQECENANTYERTALVKGVNHRQHMLTVQYAEYGEVFRVRLYTKNVPLHRVQLKNGQTAAEAMELEDVSSGDRVAYVYCGSDAESDALWPLSLSLLQGVSSTLPL
ncbi:MAG: hypothetical protein KBD21_00240 [Candidatus Pacebacteria bacterium]|nr:hypothetical protein [Candidatus Paceibacterota bacterium]